MEADVNTVPKNTPKDATAEVVSISGVGTVYNHDAVNYKHIQKTDNAKEKEIELK